MFLIEKIIFLYFELAFYKEGISQYLAACVTK